MGGLIVAGDRSGTGKTTVTLALLASLVQRWLGRSGGASHPVQSFKVGPDYIDPMFHGAVTGRPCYNLDPVLTSEAYVKTCYRQHATRYTVVEGVMGLFDGADTESDFASTAHIARLLNLPVALVVDCGRMSRSVAALVLGYQKLDPRIAIAGVILNRVGSDRHLTFLRSALDSIGIPILGIFNRDTDITLPDRHLGLVPVDELDGFRQTQARLAEFGEAGFDWEKLAPIFSSVPQPEQAAGNRVAMVLRTGLAIAVARDRAFNFYYPDNLSLLEQAGAQLRYWSPMTEPFPTNVQGLYLGGGFPEMFARDLAHNQAARLSVQQAVLDGLPTYAECGGLMYLCEQLVDFNGQAWPMAGAIRATVRMGQRLNLGYRQAQVLTSGPLMTTGQTITGHEFHRSCLETVENGTYSAIYKSQRAFGVGDAVLAGLGTPSLHASYLHLHWGTHPALPQRFVEQCQQWQVSQ